MAKRLQPCYHDFIMSTNITATEPRLSASASHQAALKAAWEKSGVLAQNSSSVGSSPADTVNDTVSLSEGGQKIVNLNRGNDLAANMRKAPLDDSFQDSLRKATQDIMRISRLFGETIKAAFASWR